VIVPLATSDGECFEFVGLGVPERRHLQHLQRRVARQKRGSNRRKRTVRAIARIHERIRNRRLDFCHQTAHAITTAHGLVVVEDLRVKCMTASARGTIEAPGSNVGQKAELNRSILDKAWGQLRSSLEWHGRKNGCDVMAVPAAYTSQTCFACEQIAAESRDNQARFCCVACGYQANADVNAARNILALGAEGVWTWRMWRQPADEASTTRTGGGVCRRLNGNPWL
jgi:IS605 OrfB family transposase